MVQAESRAVSGQWGGGKKGGKGNDPNCNSDAWSQ